MSWNNITYHFYRHFKVIEIWCTHIACLVSTRKVGLSKARKSFRSFYVLRERTLFLCSHVKISNWLKITKHVNFLRRKRFCGRIKFFLFSPILWSNSESSSVFDFHNMFTKRRYMLNCLWLFRVQFCSHFL